MSFIDFSGRAVLLTGAGSGIGRATAVLFAEFGCRSILLVGRNLDRLNETKKIVGNKNPSCRVEVHSVDLASSESILEFTKQVLAEYKTLDFLVNNAGMFEGNALAQIRNESIGTQMQVNFSAPLLLIQGLVKLLETSSLPSIINVSSTLAVKPIVDTVVYNSSKAALLQMTRTLAVELATKSIRVNAVVPAVVDTPMFASRFSSGEECQEGKASMAAIHPLGRIGRPEDIANAIAFLCSDRAAWVTGVSLPVDGGMLCT